MQQKKFKNLLISLFIIVIIFALFYAYNSSNKIEEISYQQFQEKVIDGDVSYAYAVGTTIRVRLIDGQTTVTVDEFKNSGDADYIVTLPDRAEFITFLYNYNHGLLKDSSDQQIVPTVQVDYNYEYQPESILTTLLPYLSFILIAVFAFFIIRSIGNANSKSMSFGKTRARDTQMSKIKFSDVAGAKEEKQELTEIVDFLKSPSKYTELGARIPKGVLLIGPPGTGKTMLAKAVAGESKVPFFRISGSDFVEMFVGVGASRVRDLFDQAKHNAPCIVFIDEIDAVGRQRGAGMGGGNDEREQTLNQLLVEMDGFETNEGIIVIAATNRPDVLDPALLRPGRFDRTIFVNLPDVGEREAILRIHARNKHFSDDISFENLARLTSGFSGADLENLLNESAILAARDNRPRITMQDINEATNKVLMGPQKKSHIVTERDRKITAYHESGHAIVQKLLPFADAVHEVSIISRGSAGGYTMTRPDTDDNYTTYKKLNNMIASAMGGRVAEELIFGDISTGASSDIEKATKIARKMVTEFGMSKRLGFINLGSSNEVFLGRDYTSHVEYSEETAGIIDEEMHTILSENYETAKKLLAENKDKLDAMAELLLKKETIYQDEVDALMSGKSVRSIILKMDKREKTEKKEIEKEKEIKKQREEKRLQELKERAFNALKKEGIISPNAKLVDNSNSQPEEKVNEEIVGENKVEVKVVEEEVKPTETEETQPKEVKTKKVEGKNPKAKKSSSKKKDKTDKTDK